MLNLISQFSLCSRWEQELAKARKKNRKPRLRNALFQTFWMSCVVDGFLVFLFTLLKSIMPVFLAQLLIQFQLPPKSDNATLADDNYETTTTLPTTTVEITTMQTIMPGSNDDDDSILERVFQYMLFIWWVWRCVGVGKSLDCEIWSLSVNSGNCFAQGATTKCFSRCHPIINLRCSSNLSAHSQERCLLVVIGCHFNYAVIVHHQPSHGSSSANGRRSDANRLLSCNLSEDAADVEASNDANICRQCCESAVERREPFGLWIHLCALHLDIADSG